MSLSFIRHVEEAGGNNAKTFLDIPVSSSGKCRRKRKSRPRAMVVCTVYLYVLFDDCCE